jgi:hypothetical protein
MGPGSAGWEGQGAALYDPHVEGQLAPYRETAPVERSGSQKAKPRRRWRGLDFSARKEPAERLWPYRQAGILASSSDGSRSTYPRPHTVSM